MTEREHLNRCAAAWSYNGSDPDASSREIELMLDAEAGVDLREALALAVRPPHLPEHRRPNAPPPCAVLEH
jgi:hypothetical protein